MKKLLLFVLSFFSMTTIVFAENFASNAKSAILMEFTTGKILYEKNSNERLAPASMTKVMTLLLTMEAIDEGKLSMDSSITISDNAASMGGSQMFLDANTSIKLEELIKGVSIVSANDAAVALAEAVGGSQENFVKLMNEKAKELNLENTTFLNPHGLDTDGHYTTAHDMAIMARELIKHENILKYTSTYEDYFNKSDGSRTWLVNTKKLVRFYPGVDGLKTGFTDNAGYCLAATSKRDNVRLIGIVLGEKDSKVRNSETINLLDYGFNNVKVNVLKRKGSIIDYLSLEKANIKNVPILLKNDLIVIDGPSDKKKIKYKVQFNNYNLPIKKKTVIGKIKAFYMKNLISEEDLIIGESIRKIDYFDLLKEQLINLLLGII